DDERGKGSDRPAARSGFPVFRRSDESAGSAPEGTVYLAGDLRTARGRPDDCPVERTHEGPARGIDARERQGPGYRRGLRALSVQLNAAERWRRTRKIAREVQDGPRVLRQGRQRQGERPRNGLAVLSNPALGDVE